jgi:hypothetical protein
MRSRRLLAAVLSVAVLSVAVLAPQAHSQTVPFGKNKIQYESFDWHVMSGEHLDVYYYPEEEEVARVALAYGEESYAFLEQKFQHHPFERIPLIVYASDTHFEQTNLLPGHIPEGVLGFTEYLKRRVALPFRGDYEQFRSTLRHELVHAFQLSKLSETTRLQGRMRGMSPQRVHWWSEGLAEFWSSEQTPEDDMYVRDLVVTGRLPSIRDFSAMYTFYSYPLGAELHKYLQARFGEQYIVRMYEEYWKYDNFNEALESILGVDIDRLTREWQYSLEQRFFPSYAKRPPLDVGATVLVEEGGSNFKPVVHASGSDTTLYYLSTSSGYANVYRQQLSGRRRDTETVLEGERSAEFESFHAYESAFDINANGLIVIGSRFLDRDALLIWDPSERDVVGRYQWPDIVGVRSPRWSRDGKRVVFSGLTASGFSDLFLLDFETQALQRLTEDRFRDEDPDFSPDGGSVVFASDRSRFGPEGARNLVLIDVDSRAMRFLTWGNWRDRAPRYAADGRIAFSSDRSGSSDLYLIDEQGSGHRLTELTGGAFDPAWLPDGRSIVFAGFQNSRFRIYRQNLPERGAAIALDAAGAASDAIGTTAVAWTWHELTAPGFTQAEGRPYSTWDKMSIDFAAADAMLAPGYGAAQGAQFLASDMLGNHILFLGVSAFQAGDLSDFVDSFSGSALYLNLSHRLNYGVGLFRYQGLFRDVSWDIYEDESYGGYFVASYPFSRYQRVELQLGLQQSNRNDIEDISEVGGIDGNADIRDLTRSGLLTTNTVVYVKDNTLWLPTGPIDGERFHVAVGLVSCFSCEAPSAVTGQPIARSAAAENYAIALDYRRYFRTSLLTAYAVRGFGYFSDGAIPGRAVLGGSHQLRGYPRYSLAGSRVWLVNQEWRFPILHGVSLTFPFGTLALPGVQGAVFADIGSSWLEGRNPAGTWGSYGSSFRMSLGAPLVLRMDVGRRFKSGAEPPVVFRNSSFNDTFIDFFFGFNF